jgi:hypothetical protein
MRMRTCVAADPPDPRRRVQRRRGKEAMRMAVQTILAFALLLALLIINRLS